MYSPLPAHTMVNAASASTQQREQARTHAHPVTLTVRSVSLTLKP